MFGLFKSNKIKKMRKNLSDSGWLINKYNELLRESAELDHFLTFECSSTFKGYELANHNKKRYNIRDRKNNKRLAFIRSCIKKVKPTYYIKYIGKISEEEMVAIRRDNKLKKLIK